MRLWYQSFGWHDGFSDYAKTLHNVVTGAADPGTEVSIHGLTRSGATNNYFRWLEFLDTKEVIENGIAAQKAGYDAVLVGNIADPGLRELREILTVPVLGLCETALHLACLMGGGFSIVTLNDKFTPRVLENIDRYGLSKRLVSVEKLKTEQLWSMNAAFHDPAAEKAFAAQFAGAAAAGIAKGADVVIPAGGVVMAFLAKIGMHDVDGARVVNGMLGLVKLGEAAVKLQALTGGFISKRGTHAPPVGEVLASCRARYGDEIYPF